jgi:hypothetical protein
MTEECRQACETAAAEPGTLQIETASVMTVRNALLALGADPLAH